MAAVVLADPDGAGLAAMLAGLLEAAITQPAKAALLEKMRGTVTIDVPDAEVAVGLRFSGGTCRVESAEIPGSTVRITMPADRVLGMSTIPLLLGLPSVLTPDGRAFTKDVLRGTVRIRGLRHLGLITRLNRLLALA